MIRFVTSLFNASTDKIYKEGVEKGNEEAGRIIAEANAQKDTILKDAEAEAKRIVAAAEKQAAELKKNTEAELKLFATQSVEALKSEVTNLITGDISSSNVKAALMDPAYMQKVILELVKSWPANEFLTIQASDSDGLKAYFEANAKGLLEKDAFFPLTFSILYPFSSKPLALASKGYDS